MNSSIVRFGTERPLVQIQSPRQKQGRRRPSSRSVEFHGAKNALHPSRAGRGDPAFCNALTDVVGDFGAVFDAAVKRKAVAEMAARIASLGPLAARAAAAMADAAGHDEFAIAEAFCVAFLADAAEMFAALPVRR